MSLQPIKDVSEYRRLKQTLRDCFDNERTGDQNLFEEQIKKYNPLLTSQQEISKSMQDAAKQIVESQNEGQTALQPLLPLLQNIQRTQITQQTGAPRRQLPSLSSYVLPPATTPSQYATPQASASGQDVRTTHIPVPVSAREDIISVDFDNQLDVSDFDNLRTMNLPKPSEAFKTNKIAETLESIKTHNRAIGQKLGKGPASKKLTASDKSQLESQRVTLKKYSDISEATEAGKKMIVSHKTDKTGSGIHAVSFYSSVDDLCSKLALLHAAKQAGNNGLNNNINSILDELLRTNAIDKNKYNDLYKAIFH